MSAATLQPRQAAVARRSVTAWRGLATPVQLYVAAVGGAGSVAVMVSLAQIAPGDVPLFVAFTALSLVTSGAKVKLPLARGASTMSICYVIDFTTLLLLGAPAATVTAAAGAWSQCVIRREYPTPAYQTWFSIGALALTVQGAGLAYTLRGTLPAVTSGVYVEGALAAATAFFILNSGFVAAAVALSTRQSTLRVWTANFLWSWPGHLVGFTVAVGAAAGIGQSEVWLIPFAIVSLLITYDNFRAYVARFTDSITDPLTGLANTRHLMAQFEHELARARRDGASLALIVVDLDDFKAINDTHGHHTGDLALRQVGRCLQQSTRSYDLCARYGGDEFVLVLPGCGRELAERKARGLQRAIAALPLRPRGGEAVALQVSVGVALCPVDGDDFEALLAAADARMFDDKAGGGGALALHGAPRLAGDGAGRPKGRATTRELQEQLLHAQKLAAIGQLTGGVAHDFNNVLTAILGYSELLARQIGPDKPIGRDLAQIVTAANHGAALTHQLLTFSRSDPGARTPVDVNDVAVAAQSLLERLLEEHITISAALEPGLPRVMGDPTELEQVIVNLAVNARDAMPGGGDLRIETRSVTIDAAAAQHQPGGRPGRYVALSIADTGEGMPPDIVARVFEPFFTTKGRDHGTGLGLSIVHRIVSAMDGYISIDSVLGRGTTVHVYLPDSKMLAPGPLTSSGDRLRSLPPGSEQILLVEDQERVRDFVINALERHGYHVWQAATAEDALRMLERRHSTIRLVVADVVLPGKNGRALAAEIAARYPGVPVLLTTGYGGSPAEAGSTPLLIKPFTALELLTAVRTALDEARKGNPEPL